MTGGRLSNRVILVTGASRGLGRAIALACAADGAAVIGASRSAAPSGSLAPGEVTSAHLDVRNPASVDALYAFVDRTAGRVDALVNSAGAFAFKPIDELSLDEWTRVIDTNLTGAFLCSAAALARMKKAGGGRIVTIGSIAGRLPLVECGAYGASKFGVRGLSQVLTEEGKAHGVFATLVSLGAVNTGAFEGRAGFDPAEMLSVEDVAEAVVEVLAKRARVRVDEVELMPPKGIL